MNLTQTITTPLEWADLVLDERTMKQVDEIRSWLRHAPHLLSDNKLQQQGCACLFYGMQGTGKTLVACLLGKHANRELHRVDLSVLVSKYIGETEKNLERVFAHAEAHNAILFFDEADALFGKRTSVSDAHDRYANQEVSYLLQRIEDFPGVIILATNMKNNMDEAFIRRMRFVVQFSMPAAQERLHLWQVATGSGMPLDAAINLKDIALQYPLTGGQIVNAYRHSTVCAAQQHHTTIGIDCLTSAIEKELPQYKK